MGPARLLCANNAQARVFKFSQAFYSIFNNRRQQIVFGERPADLQAVGSIDKHILEKRETYLKRIENYPLKKAIYYRNLRESTGVISVRGLSEITGEDWSYIARVLKTLNLAQGIQDFLNKNPFPQIVKHFNLRRLLEIVRLDDEESQMSQFQKVLANAAIINSSEGANSG